jgi:tetratricopeptide (TPR) repeat protein
MSSAVSQYSGYGKLTNFDRIVDNGAATTVFPQAFGSISNNNWCYYFEKADLAKQEKNWQQVISLYDQAKQKGFTPGHSVEYIPLINALAEEGKVSEALQTTNTAIQFSTTVTPAACKLWSNLMQEHSNITEAQVTQALGQGTCGF